MYHGQLYTEHSYSENNSVHDNKTAKNRFRKVGIANTGVNTIKDFYMWLFYLRFCVHQVEH